MSELSSRVKSGIWGKARDVLSNNLGIRAGPVCGLLEAKLKYEFITLIFLKHFTRNEAREPEAIA